MRTSAIVSVALALLLAACSQSEQSARYVPAAAPSEALARDAKSPQAAGRHIAVSHRLAIETAEADLAGAWEAATRLCHTARCEILSSSISNRGSNAPPSASLALRIAPEDLPKLLEQLGRTGSVLQHSTDAVDKTAQVIDVEARQHNQTQFRDRLRSMLASRTGALKDLIEVERELARVQAELDSLAAQRKVLANETEMISVQIDFRARLSAVSTGVFAPLVHAWNGAAQVFAISLAAMLTFVVAVLPWLALVVPLLWLSIRLVRRLWRRRDVAQAAST